MQHIQHGIMEHMFPFQNTGTSQTRFCPFFLSTLSADAIAAIFSLSFNEESGKVVTSCRNHARAAAAAATPVLMACNRPTNSPSQLSVGGGSRVCRPLFGGAILTRSLLDDGRQTVALQRSAPQFSVSGRSRSFRNGEHMTQIPSRFRF